VSIRFTPLSSSVERIFETRSRSVFKKPIGAPPKPSTLTCKPVRPNRRFSIRLKISATFGGVQA
jgi:hypothetical protein